MNSTLMRDTFAYFAKFPLLSGVKKNFTKTSSGTFIDYAAFKARIDGLSENSLLADITDYIFGVDENIIKKRIQDINGIFLFIDYGNLITDRQPPLQIENNEFQVAVTVARPIKADQIDPIEAVLSAEQTLTLITSIKDRMWTDSKSNYLLKQITFPAEITPWFARDLSDSSGWSMLFSKKGVQFI